MQHIAAQWNGLLWHGQRCVKKCCHSFVQNKKNEDEQTNVWSSATSKNCSESYGYGSIPIDTIFSGMNIHKSQLFWGSLGTRVLTHPHIFALIFDLGASRDTASSTEGVVKAATACCCCCLNCFEQVLRYLNSGWQMVATFLKFDEHFTRVTQR